MTLTQVGQLRLVMGLAEIRTLSETVGATAHIRRTSPGRIGAHCAAVHYGPCRRVRPDGA